MRVCHVAFQVLNRWHSDEIKYTFLVVCQGEKATMAKQGESKKDGGGSQVRERDSGQILPPPLYMSQFLAVVLLPVERAVFDMAVSYFNHCGKTCWDCAQLNQSSIPPGMGNYGMGQMEQHQVSQPGPCTALNKGTCFRSLRSWKSLENHLSC